MSVLAWHFVGDKLRNGDPVPPDGEWLEYRGQLSMCAAGLHASVHPFDALVYAPGSMLCRVECDGDIIHGDDKLVCSRRKIIARRNAAEGLRYFARMQVLSLAHFKKWDCSDAVLDWIMTGDDSLRRAVWSSVRSDRMKIALRWASSWASPQEIARATVWESILTRPQSADLKAARTAARDDWAELVAEAFEGID